MKEQQVFGVLAGLVTDENGAPFIALDVNGQRIALGPSQALVLFDQLGNMLEAVGMFDEPGMDDVNEEEEHPKCH